MSVNSEPGTGTRRNKLINMKMKGRLECGCGQQSMALVAAHVKKISELIIIFINEEPGVILHYVLEIALIST